MGPLSQSLSSSTRKTSLSAFSAPNPGSYHHRLELPALLKPCILFILGTLWIPQNISRTVNTSLVFKV